MPLQYIRYRLKRNRGVFIPEFRFHPMIHGLTLMGFGPACFGICVVYKTHWMGPVSMMAITIFCYQQLISLGMAFVIDCHKPQAPYVAAAMMFCRQLFEFTVNYWSLPWVENAGFRDIYIAQGCVVLVGGCGPIVLLMIWGKEWREARSVPTGFGKSQ